MMEENTEELPCFGLQFTNPRNGEKIFTSFSMQDVMEKMEELDRLTERYNEQFNNLFNSLCPQFDERLSVIGGWINAEYHIMPTRKDFIEWFIRTKIGAYKMNVKVIGENSEEYSEGHRNSIDWWFPDYENTFIPNLIDDYLLEYCQEYVNGLKLKKEKLLLQLSTPDHAEEGKTVDAGNGETESSIKLSHFEIALLYHYLDVKINHGSNADSIAKKYQQGSGEVLMEKVELIKNSPLEITNNRFSKRYHKNIIDNGLLDNCPTGKEKAINALNRIELKNK
jgi:hypothetical protein